MKCSDIVSVIPLIGMIFMILFDVVAPKVFGAVFLPRLEA
jgi:hypothetical protein